MAEQQSGTLAKSGLTRLGRGEDLLAGVTAAAVILPKAMAYATVAGLPVTSGLCTAILPIAVYALLGTSRVLSVSTTTTLAILTGAQLSLVIPDGDPARLLVAAATLTFLVGILLALAALFRFGFVANFISESVLTGFKAGIGMVIVLDQAPKLLGLHLARTSFLKDLVALARHLPETSTATLALAVVTLLVLAAMERWLPHSPAPLLAVGGGIAASWLLDLGGRGVATVGAIPAGLPSPTLPDPTLLEPLLPAALGIALMSFTETIAAGRAFRAGAEPPILANRELVATGAANLAGGLLGAMPAGGGTTQTAVQRALGARTQLASLVVAATAVATLLFLAPLFAYLPQATLAAVVIVYSIGLVQPREFLAIRRVRRMEFRWAVFAFLGVLFFGTLRGILVAIVISLLALARLAANPEVHRLGRRPGTSFFRPVSPEHPHDETFPGLLLARPEGSIFFVNAQRIGEQLHRLIEADRPEVVALDLRSVPDLEYTGLRALMEAERRAREHGVELWLVALNPEALDVVRRSGFADELGPDAMYFSLETAVERFLTRSPAPSGKGDVK